MILATITNTTTGDSLNITRSPGATAPACLQFSDAKCGYWESSLELFAWACNAAKWNVCETLFTVAHTGDVFTYEDLLDIDYEEAIYRYYKKTSGDH